MKLTKTGYRISKKGKPIDSVEKEAIVKDINLGQLIKEDGFYYFFSRKQGDKYIYLP